MNIPQQEKYLFNSSVGLFQYLRTQITSNMRKKNAKFHLDIPSLLKDYGPIAITYLFKVIIQILLTSSSSTQISQNSNKLINLFNDLISKALDQEIFFTAFVQAIQPSQQVKHHILMQILSKGQDSRQSQIQLLLAVALYLRKCSDVQSGKDSIQFAIQLFYAKLEEFYRSAKTKAQPVLKAHISSPLIYILNKQLQCLYNVLTTSSAHHSPSANTNRVNHHIGDNFGEIYSEICPVKEADYFESFSSPPKPAPLSTKSRLLSQVKKVSHQSNNAVHAILSDIDDQMIEFLPKLVEAFGRDVKSPSLPKPTSTQIVRLLLFLATRRQHIALCEEAQSDKQASLRNFKESSPNSAIKLQHPKIQSTEIQVGLFKSNQSDVQFAFGQGIIASMTSDFSKYEEESMAEDANSLTQKNLPFFSLISQLKKCIDWKQHVYWPSVYEGLDKLHIAHFNPGDPQPSPSAQLLSHILPQSRDIEPFKISFTTGYGLSTLIQLITQLSNESQQPSSIIMHRIFTTTWQNIDIQLNFIESTFDLLFNPNLMEYCVYKASMVNLQDIKKRVRTALLSVLNGSSSMLNTINSNNKNNYFAGSLNNASYISDKLYPPQYIEFDQNKPQQSNHQNQIKPQPLAVKSSHFGKQEIRLWQSTILLERLFVISAGGYKYATKIRRIFMKYPMLFCKEHLLFSLGYMATKEKRKYPLLEELLTDLLRYTFSPQVDSPILFEEMYRINKLLCARGISHLYKEKMIVGVDSQAQQQKQEQSQQQQSQNNSTTPSKVSQPPPQQPQPPPQQQQSSAKKDTPACTTQAIVLNHISLPQHSKHLTLSRVLDLTQQIRESLLFLVKCSDYEFAIILGILAGKREFLHFDEWLNDRINKRAGSPFVIKLLHQVQKSILNPIIHLMNKNRTQTGPNDTEPLILNNMEGRRKEFRQQRDQLIERSQLSQLSILILFMNLTNFFTNSKSDKVIDKIAVEAIIYAQDMLSLTLPDLFAPQTDFQNMMPVQSFRDLHQEQALKRFSLRGEREEESDEQGQKTNQFHLKIQGTPPTPQVQAEANQILQSVLTGSRTVEQIIQIMSKFKRSNDRRKREVEACIMFGILDEFNFFHKYPEKQLQIMGKLFGQIIRFNIIQQNPLAQKVIRKYIFQSLSRQTGQLSKFGASAIQQMLTVLKQWPDYIKQILSIPNLDANLGERLMKELKKILQTVNQEEKQKEKQQQLQQQQLLAMQQSINRAQEGEEEEQKRQDTISEKPSKKSKLRGNSKQSKANSSVKQQSISSSAIPEKIPEQPNESEQSGEVKKQEQTSKIQLKPPSGTLDVSAQAFVPQRQQLQQSQQTKSMIQQPPPIALSTTPPPNFLQQINLAASGMSTKISEHPAPYFDISSLKTLQVLTFKRNEISQSLQQRFNAIFNKLTKTNIGNCIDESANVVNDLATAKGFSLAIVISRASSEPKYQQLYLNFVQQVRANFLQNNSKESDLYNHLTKLPELVLKQTSFAINRLFQFVTLLIEQSNDSSNIQGYLDSKFDKKILKNLGAFLGKQTIQKNKPVLKRQVQINRLLKEAYANPVYYLQYALDFLNSIFEQRTNNTPFSAYNPWILSILRKVQMIGSKLKQQTNSQNVPVQILSLYSKFGVNQSEWFFNYQDSTNMMMIWGPNQIRNSVFTSSPLKSLVKSQEVKYQKVQAVVVPQQPQQKKQQQIQQPQVQQPPQYVEKQEQEIKRPVHQPQQQEENRKKVNEAKSAILAAQMAGQSIMGTEQRDQYQHHQDELQYISANGSRLRRLVKIDESLLPLNKKYGICLSDYAARAVDKAILQILTPVIERSVNIALITMRKLVLKDFQNQPSVEKLKCAARDAAKSFAGSLALVTCRQPLRVSLQNFLKAELQQKVQNISRDDKQRILSKICQDNGSAKHGCIKLGCSLIQKTVIQRADLLVKQNEQIREAIKLRQKYAQVGGGRSFAEFLKDEMNDMPQQNFKRNCDLFYATNPPQLDLPNSLSTTVQGLSPSQFEIYQQFSNLDQDSNPLVSSPAKSPSQSDTGHKESQSKTTFILQLQQAFNNFLQAMKKGLNLAQGTSSSSQTQQAQQELKKITSLLMKVKKQKQEYNSVAVEKQVEQWVRDSVLKRVSIHCEPYQIVAVSQLISALCAIGLIKSIKNIIALWLMKMVDKCQSEIVEKLQTTSNIDLRQKIWNSSLFKIVETNSQFFHKNLVNIQEWDNLNARQLRNKLEKKDKQKRGQVRKQDAKSSKGSSSSSSKQQKKAPIIQVQDSKKLQKDTFYLEFLKRICRQLVSGPQQPGDNNKPIPSVELIQIGRYVQEFICNNILLLQQSNNTLIRSNSPIYLTHPLQSSALQQIYKILTGREGSLQNDWTQMSDSLFRSKIKDVLHNLLISCIQKKELSKIMQYSEVVRCKFGLTTTDPTRKLIAFRRFTQCALQIVLSKCFSCVKDGSNQEQKYPSDRLDYIYIEIFLPFMYQIIFTEENDDQLIDVQQEENKFVSQREVVNQINRKDRRLKIFFQVFHDSIAYHHQSQGLEFNPRPYYRMLKFLIYNTNRDKHQETFLIPFANFLISLSPAEYPSFALTWVQLFTNCNYMCKLYNDSKLRAHLSQLICHALSLLQVVLRQCENDRIPNATRNYFTCMLRLLGIIRKQCPSVLIEYHFDILHSAPQNAIQMRNIILSAIPSGAEKDLPDPKRKNLRVDLIRAIRIPPTIYSNYKQWLDGRCISSSDKRNRGNKIVESLMEEISICLSSNNKKSEDDNDEYTDIHESERDNYLNALTNKIYLVATKSECNADIELVMHAILLYALERIFENGPESSKLAKSNKGMNFIIELNKKLSMKEKRALINAIVNELRFPSCYVYFLEKVLKRMFKKTEEESEQEQIAKQVQFHLFIKLFSVLYERLVIKPPFAWALIVTMRDFLTSRKILFFDRVFIKRDKQAEEKFLRILNDLSPPDNVEEKE